MSTLRCAAALLLACFVGFCASDVTRNTDTDEKVVIRLRTAASDQQPNGPEPDYTSGSIILTFMYEARWPRIEIKESMLLEYGNTSEYVEERAGFRSADLRYVNIQYRPDKGFPSTVELDGIRIILSDGKELSAGKKLLSEEKNVQMMNYDYDDDFRGFWTTAVFNLRSAGSDQQPSGLNSTSAQPFGELQYSKESNGFKGNIVATVPLSSRYNYPMTFEAGRKLKAPIQRFVGISEITSVAIKRYDSDEPWRLDTASVTLTSTDGDIQTFCSTGLTLTKNRKLNLEYQSDKSSVTDGDAVIRLRLRSAKSDKQPSESASTTASLTLKFAYAPGAPATSVSFKSYEMGKVELSAGIITELPIPVCNDLAGLERVDIVYNPHDGSAARWKLDSIKIIFPHGLEFCAKKRTLRASRSAQVSAYYGCTKTVIRLQSVNYQYSGRDNITIKPYLQLQYAPFNQADVEVPLSSSGGPIVFRAGRDLELTNRIPRSLKGLQGVDITCNDESYDMWSLQWVLDSVSVALMDVEGGYRTFCGKYLYLTEYTKPIVYEPPSLYEVSTRECSGGCYDPSRREQ